MNYTIQITSQKMMNDETRKGSTQMLPFLFTQNRGQCRAYTNTVIPTNHPITPHTLLLLIPECEVNICFMNVINLIVT